MKTIVIVSDVLAGKQVNGVGTWLIYTKKELEKKGFNVKILDAALFEYTFPLPSYPEICLVLSRKKTVQKFLESFHPDYIHIATEGTLGLLARQVCVKKGWSFTSSYHTRFPEYISARIRIDFLQALTYDYMRWFHNVGARTVVSTETMQLELEKNQFANVVVVPLGVETNLFRRNPQAVAPPELRKPVFVYFGRVAVEKNVEAFLQCKLPGSKLVIGDGPEKKSLEEKYPGQALFVGYKHGQELVDLLSIGDVYVFTSRTDTFGLTIIEALSCGLPVAAYDVQGPKNIITSGKDGFLGENLQENAIGCLTLSQEKCRQTAEKYSWESSSLKFIDALVQR